MELVSLVYRDTPLSLVGDPLRLKQILTNLVNNAIFFKQKTAYEIADSDWSSDVCSSDLNGAFYTAVTGWGPAATQANPHQPGQQRHRFRFHPGLPAWRARQWYLRG